MTDLDLQKNIVDKLQKLLMSQGIMFLLVDKLENLKVYIQDLPIKDDEDDEALRNYVLVMIGDEDVQDDEWNVEIHFSINIEDRDRDRSGNINVLYMMNEIYAYFVKNGIVGKHCRMEKEAHKRLNMEAQYPFYEGDLITYWKLPVPDEEGLEELI